MPKVNPAPSRKAENSRRYRERRLAAAGGRKRQPSYDASSYREWDDPEDDEPIIPGASDPVLGPGTSRRRERVRDELGEIPVVDASDLPGVSGAGSGGGGGGGGERLSDDGGGGGDQDEYEEEGWTSWEEEEEEEAAPGGGDGGGEEAGADAQNDTSESDSEQEQAGGAEDEDDDDEDFLNLVRQKRPPFTKYNEDELVAATDDGLFEEIGGFLFYAHAKFSVPIKGCRQFYEFFMGAAERMVRAKREGRPPSSAEHLIRQARKSLPAVRTRLLLEDAEGGPPEEIGPVRKVRKWMTRGRVEVRRDVSMRLRGILDMVYEVHGVKTEGGRAVDQEWRTVILSSDDISETKSSTTKLKVVSLTFPRCWRAVPWLIVRTEKPGTKVEPASFLPGLLKELEEEGMTIQLYLADKKERNRIKGLIASTGYASCDHCEARGTRKQLEPVTRVKDGQKKKLARAVYWPKSAPRGRLRTNERMEAQARKWKERVDDEEEGRGRPAGRRGHKGMFDYSPLLQVEGFDLWRQSPPDPLHLLDLGLCKKIYHSCFIGFHCDQLKRPRGGAERGRLAAAVVDALDKKSPSWRARKAEQLDEALSQVKVPSAFQRRLRPVRAGHFKAAEWRQLVLLMGPHIALNVLADSPPHRAIWALFTYIYRVISGPKEIFARVYHSRMLEEAMDELHTKYEALFGAETCTSNEHSFFVHLIPFVKELGPTGSFSTEAFESSYSVTKGCFRVGTPGQLLQIFSNYSVRYRTAHSCLEDRPLVLKGRPCERSDDTHFYWRGEYYAVASAAAAAAAAATGWVAAYRIRTERLQLDGGGVALDWDVCGVRRVVGRREREREVRIRREEIECRAMRVQDLILTVRNEWVRW